MRAATVIVGSIAVSSCLVTLALLLAGGNGSDERATTSTGESGVTESPTSSPATSPQDVCTTQVTVEGAPCGLGKNVLAAYEAAGSKAGEIVTVDPESGEEISLDCRGTGPVICSGNSGVTVYLAG